MATRHFRSKPVQTKVSAAPVTSIPIDGVRLDWYPHPLSSRITGGQASAHGGGGDQGAACRHQDCAQADCRRGDPQG